MADTLHEKFADLVSEASGAPRDVVLKRLHEQCPTEQALVEFVQMVYGDDLPPNLRGDTTTDAPKH